MTLDNLAMVSLLAAIAAVQAVLLSGAASLCRLVSPPGRTAVANQPSS